MGRKFTSSPQKIQVFPPFKLVPKKIILIPQNMMQVMSEGGPQPQSIIHFSVTNRSVAEVDRLGQVTARRVGTATIQGAIQAVSEDTGKITVFSQDEVELEVTQLRAVRIHVPVTRLVTGTEMPVYVMGLTNMLNPFSFANANPELVFQWSVSKRDVLDLLSRQTEVSVQLPAERNFAMVIYTKAAGRTTLKVTVQCLNASAGQFEGNLTELSDEVQIMVFDKLLLFSPPFSTQQILMSTNSQLRLLTNREGAAFVSTQILQCYPNSSVLEEHDQGLLRAGAVTGTAVLEVTSLELFGINQTFITGVQVAPVTYLRISVSPKLYTSNSVPLHALPLGMSLTLTVQFYNNIGEKFHAQNTQLYLALNRYDDLLLIRPGNKNYSYIAQTVNRGVTLLTIQDEKRQGMADYIPVPVDYAIRPNLSKSIAVGDVICFSSPLVTQDGEPGLWHISPRDVLEIDPVSGAAFVENTGTATIFYDIPGIERTYREVFVTLSWEKTSLLLCTKKYFFIYVVFQRILKELVGFCPCSSLHFSAITELLHPESRLICQVEFSNNVLDVSASEVFLVRSEFSIQKGECSDIGIIRQLMSSYQILLFTLFAVLASTAVIFLTYNAFLTRVQTVPIVYVPAAPASQTGKPAPFLVGGSSLTLHFVTVVYTLLFTPASLSLLHFRILFSCRFLPGKRQDSAVALEHALMGGHARSGEQHGALWFAPKYSENI
uniref:BIG2 domain-containing protein n=1 Tax=Nothoprocta perdicaria TaxID=30464 RepID=A0A8C6Z3F6_NOTPE